MSFAKAKRENKKIEARQEKRDLEDKYKALEVSYDLHKQIFLDSFWCLGFGDGTVAAYASGIGHSRPKTCPPKGDFCPNAYTESPHMIQICQEHRN